MVCRARVANKSWLPGRGPCLGRRAASLASEDEVTCTPSGACRLPSSDSCASSQKASTAEVGSCMRVGEAPAAALGLGGLLHVRAGWPAGQQVTAWPAFPLWLGSARRRAGPGPRLLGGRSEPLGTSGWPAGAAPPQLHPGPAAEAVHPRLALCSGARGTRQQPGRAGRPGRPPSEPGRTYSHCSPKLGALKPLGVVKGLCGSAGCSPGMLWRPPALFVPRMEERREALLRPADRCPPCLPYAERGCCLGDQVAMSWLTPKHLQDASRILRSLALVATRAAAET